MENKKVACIGTGVMGSQQAGHLAKNGYDVSAYTHKYEKLLELEKEFGIHPCHSTAEAVKDADYIFVMVGYPSDVEEVFCGESGIFQSAKPGALAIDMTTSSPSLAQRLYEEGSWQLQNMAPRALAGDFAPGFFVKHFIKDMKIVKEESEKEGVELQMLNAVLHMYEQMADQGLENDGTQALIKLYNK